MPVDRLDGWFTVRGVWCLCRGRGSRFVPIADMPQRAAKMIDNFILAVTSKQLGWWAKMKKAYETVSNAIFGTRTADECVSTLYRF